MLPDFQRTRRKKGFLTASSLLLLLAAQAFSQSGRRTPKPTATPTPQTDTDNRPKVSSRDLKHNVSLLVAKGSSSKRLLSEDAIFATLVSRLREFVNVRATDIGELKRDDAVKRAKRELEAVVVLVQFDVDEFQNGTIFLDSPDLEVKVLVFSPQSGQKKFEGNVYYRAPTGPNLKKDNWPTGTPIRITTEAVGIEVAEQVRDWLIVEDVKKRN
jgi:hypothetical protein